MKLATVATQLAPMPMQAPGPPITWNPFRVASTMSSYFAKPLEFVGEHFDRYGDIFQLRLGPGRFFFSRSPEHFHEVLVKKADSFSKGQRSGNVFREGLVALDGDIWRESARAVQPHFSRSAVEGQFETMRRLTRSLLDTCQPGVSVELDQLIARLTLDIVCQTLLAQQMDQNLRDRLLLQLDVVERSVDSFDPIPLWVPTRRHLEFARAFREIDRAVNELVRREQRSEQHTLLSDLVKTMPIHSRRNARKIRDQITALYFGGYRTSAHALVWIWYLLSEHPEVEQKLQEEVDLTLAGKEPTVEDLPRLKYVSAVVTESLRLRSPSHLVERVAKNDVQIGQFTIPAGSEVFLHIYWMQHDPRWYPEPNRFLPERRIESGPAYCPFGIGKRQCIAKGFAIQEISLAVAMMAQRFRVKIAPGFMPDPQTLITYGLRPPVPATLVPRQRTNGRCPVARGVVSAAQSV